MRRPPSVCPAPGECLWRRLAFWRDVGDTVTLPWIIAAAAVGVIAGPRIRASVFARSTESGQPPRRACLACGQEILPVTGRCPRCRARIGPYPLLAELATGLALAVVAARASSVWELAALAWLVLLAVPLAFIDVAVRRLPDPLTAAAFAGTLTLLAIAALTGHQPGHLGRAAIGAVALACFYLVLAVIRPGGLGLGDAKLAASIGLVLGWTSWQALLTGTFAGLALAAVYGGVQMARKKATRNSQLPLGPFILLGVLAALVLLHARPARGARSTAPSRPVRPAQHGVLPLLRRHDVQQPGDRGSLEITAPGRPDVALLLL